MLYKQSIFHHITFITFSILFLLISFSNGLRFYYLPSVYPQTEEHGVQSGIKLEASVNRQVILKNPWPIYLQLPFSSGQTWLANGGVFGRGSASQHSYEKGGAIDFQPYTIGCGDDETRDTSINWDCSPSFNNSLYPVVAAAAGRVSQVTANTIVIDHQGFSTYYWHVEQIAVTETQQVTANQTIALIADTELEAEAGGYTAYGPHLHFHIRPNGENSAYKYMDGIYLSGYLVGYVPDVTSFTKGEQVVKLNQDALTSEYQPFWDVPNPSTFFSYISNLALRDISSGYSNGGFKPDALITRGEVSKLLARSSGDVVFDDQGNSIFNTSWAGPFPDTAGTEFHNYIRYLANHANDPDTSLIRLKTQVLHGKGDGLFHPNDNVTRGEIASMIGRLYEGKGKICPDGNTYFSDVPEGSTHEKYITCLVGLGLLHGYPDRTFRPDDFATRGQTAKLISGLIDLTMPYTAIEKRIAQNLRTGSQCPLIAIGEEVLLSTPGYNREQDCLTLPAISTGTSYLIAVSDQEWNSDLKMEIRDETGAVKALRQGSPANGPLSLMWSPKVTGNYYLYLTNENLFAKEATSYHIRLNEITGSQVFRVDPSGAGLCGDDGHIQLEVTPLNTTELALEVRKCDFTRFSESGTFWIYVDGTAQWGPFTYANEVRSFNQVVQPLDKNIWGRHLYQAVIHPSNDAGRAMTTGEVQVWEFSSERNVDFRDIDYKYHIASPDTDCNGILELRLRASSHMLQARVRKCDGTAFSSSGKLWILADNYKRWGPFPFEVGETAIYTYLDPKGGYDILTYERYEAWIYSNCDHGAPNCNPNEEIRGGQVRATPYLQTVVSARRDGTVWSDVSIWRTSPNGTPNAQGRFEDYLPDGTGDWDYYLSKMPGYVIDESAYDANVNLRETSSHYIIRIVPGRKVQLDYIRDCHRLIYRAEPLEGGEIEVLTPPNCGNDLYQSGTTVTFKATPTKDYSFTNWNGAVSGTIPTGSLVMDSDKTIVAQFAEPCYQIRIQSLPENGGNVQTTAPNCDGNKYVIGSQVSIEAIPNSGFLFNGWVGSASGAQNPEVIQVSANMIITASFTTVSLTSTPSSTPTETPTNSATRTSTVTPPATPTATPTAPFTPTEPTTCPLHQLCNGNFEDGLSYWSASYRSTIVTPGRADQHAVQSIQDRQVGETPIWEGISNAVLVSPGMRYRLSAWMKWQNAASVHIKILWYDAANQQVDVDYLSDDSGTQLNWQQRSATVVAPMRAAIAHIVFWHGIDNNTNVPGSTVWIDDVTIEPIVSDATGNASPTSFYKFVRLVAQSAVNGNPWTTLSELSLFGIDGNQLASTNLTIHYVDSEENEGVTGSAQHAIDGNASTFWHTQWRNASPAHPHEIQIALSTPYQLSAFGYTARQDSENGRILGYQLFVSTDGINWGTPAAIGQFVNSNRRQLVSLLAADHLPTTPISTITPEKTRTPEGSSTVTPFPTNTPTPSPTPTATTTWIQTPPTPTPTLHEDLTGFDYELWVSPQSPQQNMTTSVGLIVHRRGGQQPASVKVNFFQGDPQAEGVLLGHGEAPMLSPNSSGSTSAIQWIPHSAGNWEIYAVIDPDNTITESNESNNQLSRAVTVLAQQTDIEPPTVDSFTINGGAATTTSRDVLLTVIATDGGITASGVRAIYIVEYILNLDLGIWVPVKKSDEWMDYKATAANAEQLDTINTHYPWQLANAPGMRYLHVWVVDRAGNISPTPKRSYINYVPTTMTVGTGAAQILRYELNAGDRIDIRVQPISGDPDIYLWTPDALTLPRLPWYSNLSDMQIDQLSVVAPVAGTYQLEIEGYIAAAFTLEVQITSAATAGAGVFEITGVDAVKPVRNTPVIPPTVLPGEQFSLTPPSVAQSQKRLYLPLVQR